MQQYAGEFLVLLVLLIKTKYERLNHQVSESVGGCSKHIGDAGVHIFIVTGVGRQLLGNEVWTNNVEQVVPESENLKDKTET